MQLTLNYIFGPNCTHITQVHKNLPDTGFIKPWKDTAVFPQEARKVAQLAKFRLDIECLVLFPTVDVREDIRVLAVCAAGCRMRQML